MLEKIIKPDTSNQITSAEETDILGSRILQFFKMGTRILGPLAILHQTIFSVITLIFVGYQKTKFVFLYFASKVLCFLSYPQYQIVKGMSARQLADTLSGGVFPVLAIMIIIWIVTSAVYLLSFPIYRYLQKRAAARVEKRHIRGGQLVESSLILKQQKESQMQGSIPLGYTEEITYKIDENGKYVLPDYDEYIQQFYPKSILLDKGLETNGVLFVGAPGTGKGLFMKPIVAQAYKNGERGIIYDAKADEYFCPFFNPEKDVLLNFCDVRGEEYLWNFFDEMKTVPEAAAIAESLIPQMEKVEPFWINAPRDILEGLIIYCYRNNKRNYADLWKIITAPALDIQDALNKTPGAEKGRRYLEDPESKMCGSVLSVLVQNTTCFSLMSRKKSKPFYITEWINSGEGFIYLTSSRDLRATLKNFYTLFIDTVARKILSQDSNLSRRIFMFLDEFATLNQCISILEMLNQGRSKGMCLFIGVQGIPQITQVYGDHNLQALITGCSTKLIFRLGDNVSAKYMEDFFGKTEEMQTEKNYQVKVEESGDGVGLANREKKKELVMASQMIYMPNKHALIFQPGFNLTMATYPIINIPNRPEVPKLIMRKDLIFEDIGENDENNNSIKISKVQEQMMEAETSEIKMEDTYEQAEIAENPREKELDIDRSIDNNSLYM